MFFNSKEYISALGSSIAFINISKTNNKASTEYSTSFQNTYDDLSGKIAAINEPQDN